MKRVRISEWPAVHVNVNPRTLEALEDEAEERGLSVSALVREALDRSVRSAASLSVLKP
jgi:Ribbon-helix-helix protein, copG family